MKKLMIAAASLLALSAYGKEYKIASPDHKIVVKVGIANNAIVWSADYDGRQLLAPSAASIKAEQNGKTLSDFSLKKEYSQSVSETIIPPVKEKRAFIPDVYNLRRFVFNNGLSLEFRVYNDGVAYRFASDRPGELTVYDEQAGFGILPQSAAHYSPSVKRPESDIFHTSFEEPYFSALIDTLSADIHMFSPILVRANDRPRMLITESDIAGYPGMFLRREEGTSVRAAFPGYPVETTITDGEFRQKQVVERAGYIAKTAGPRTFPWRVVAISDTDAGLLTNDIVYRLASPPAFADFSWIKPGKSTEEWITGLNLYGVDFRAGLNTETYKHYIDFAAEFGFEYVMLDAGWSDVEDLSAIAPGMDMGEIRRYADLKNVGLILWTSALTVERQMDDALDMLAELGAKVVMTDFIDRNDQQAIDFMHTFAGKCAERRLMCMIHGAPAPFGFSRTHPNMLTREGSIGSEYNIWSVKANPDHDLTLPFIRMAAGPMDYEPGLLQHATAAHPEKMGFERVVAQGTRMHQTAMFVIYESPLQLFSGNISDARREPELMTLTGKIPTVWDETRIIHAEFGKVIVEARRLGDEWFVAAMNNWEPFEIDVPLDFLSRGVYRVVAAADGINADRNPHDYKITSYEATSEDNLKITLAPGGGFVARLYR